jgi:hypothetical protein
MAIVIINIHFVMCVLTTKINNNSPQNVEYWCSSRQLNISSLVPLLHYELWISLDTTTRMFLAIQQKYFCSLCTESTIHHTVSLPIRQNHKWQSYWQNMYVNCASSVVIMPPTVWHTILHLSKFHIVMAKSEFDVRFFHS